MGRGRGDGDSGRRVWGRGDVGTWDAWGSEIGDVWGRDMGDAGT